MSKQLRRKDFDDSQRKAIRICSNRYGNRPDSIIAVHTEYSLKYHARPYVCAQFKHVSIKNLKICNGDVAQWYGTYLAFTRPCIQSLAQKSK